MSVVFWGLVLLFIYQLVRKILSKEKIPKGEAFIFVLNLAVFIGAFGGFLNIARFVSDTNTPITTIYGSDFWNFMSFFNLLALLILSVVSGIRLVRKNRA